MLFESGGLLGSLLLLDLLEVSDALGLEGLSLSGSEVLPLLTALVIPAGALTGLSLIGRRVFFHVGLLGTGGIDIIEVVVLLNCGHLGLFLPCCWL